MQLQCPLGTIQSRLARGRAKLKTRLEKSGRVLSSAFAAASHSDGLPSCPAPQAWAEATVRLAGEFGTQSPRDCGHGLRCAANQICRIIVLSKWKVGAAMTVLTAVFLSVQSARALPRT